MAALRWYSQPLSSLINPKNHGNKNTLPLQIKPQLPISVASFNPRQKQLQQWYLLNNDLDRSCRYSETTTPHPTSDSEIESLLSEDEYDDLEPSPSTSSSSPPNGGVLPFLKKKVRYRKAYPGENKGITEEMRFVAMKLRNDKSVVKYRSGDGSSADSPPSDGEKEGGGRGGGDGGELTEGSSDAGSGSETWQPSLEGFAKFLVDTKLVFQTLERVVEESEEIAYSYFRKTGLERTERLDRDIELLREMGVEIPEPSNPGDSYSKYLEQLAGKSAPIFLTHFYNAYFSHITGGQVIVKQVSDQLLDGREMECCRWDRDSQELLKDVRNNLNQLAEHWPRDDKNKCLREASKSFKFMGEIVRLIILM